MNKLCVTCKIEKLVDDFGNNSSRADGKQSYCKACGKAKDKKHYLDSESRRHTITERRKLNKDRNKQFVIEYLLQHPCVDCGESNPLYLDFDHVTGDKKYNVSCMQAHCFKTLIEEIEKCEVRCVKCHRRKTAIEFDWKWAREYI